MTPLLLIGFTTRFPSTTITYSAAHLRIGTGSIANFTNRVDQSFVYDTGEGDASESVERMLERPSSFMGHLLEEFHGLGILWEHR
jgi:hypothetical protein